MIERQKIKDLYNHEIDRYVSKNPMSWKAFKSAEQTLLGGVPMNWMTKWPGGFPIFLKSAIGAHVEDLDGNNYIDFCLGDTGAMAGHSSPEIGEAIRKQALIGISAMLPTLDSVVVANELAKRFGLPIWQFTVSATDANRHAIRYSRLVTGKRKIIVIDQCYHGSVDETFATLDASGNTIMREGNVGAPVDLDSTTRVVEFNDLVSMQSALKHNDVAAIIMEPAMTNVGIVLPESGYLQSVAELARKNNVIWIVDETHTISVGPGGMTAELGLRPDMLTIGKSVGGGIPTGTFGMTHEIASKITKKTKRAVIDIGGVGGTLAGNALSLAAMRVTLMNVLTDENFAKMISLGNRWCNGVETVIKEFNLPWHVQRLGARGEYSFQEFSPRTGREAAAALDFDLDQYIHLRLLNDGFLLTPFHNMALMSPYTSEEDVDAHTISFRAMCKDLVT